MLVTVSGVVGSGKTTMAKAVAERLRQDGLEPIELWNFRTLECFARLGPRASSSAAGLEEGGDSVRGKRYAPRSLTLPLAAGYALRILAFRWYRFRRRGSHHICNRYFYDNFTHFALRTRGERFWLAWLRLLVPTPDLALLVVASPETIARRRPNYAPEYLSSVESAYGRLPAFFPRLQTVSTDDERSFARVDALASALRG